MMCKNPVTGIEFDPERLRYDLIKKRSCDNDLSLTEASEQIGISRSTLRRLENYYTPDLFTLARVCSWLGTLPNDYFSAIPAPYANEVKQLIGELLRPNKEGI